MGVRRFHPRRIAGMILLSAVGIATAGCYEEIAYNPAANAPPANASPPVPQPDAPGADHEVQASEVSTSTPESPAADPLPADRYARADAVKEMASSPNSTAEESDLFAEVDDGPESVEPAGAASSSIGGPSIGGSSIGGTSRGATQAMASDEAIFPWESEEQEAEALREAEQPANAVVEAPPSAEVQPDGVFPWDAPDDTVPPEEPPAAPSEDQPPSATEQLPPALGPPEPVEISVPESPPASPAENPPANPQSPATSRHAAWLLGSKVSYAVLAPEGEARQVVPELQPLAHLLGVELPHIDYDRVRGTSAGMSQLLTAGRDLGEQLASRHDPAHAALVEIAMKSNLLLAVHADRPHLTHSIGGSVAAACVRAGIPERIWQPWQDTVVAGGSTDEVTTAVLELHHQIDAFLKNPPDEAAEAILR